VANSGSNSVSKLTPEGSAQTYAVGNNPQGITFDGTYIWVANRGDDTVTKLRTSDGALIGTYNAGNMDTLGYAPGGIAFDGEYIWVANQASNSVTKLRASDGVLIGTYATGVAPMGIAFDGANIWVTDSGSDTVSKL